MWQQSVIRVQKQFVYVGKLVTVHLTSSRKNSQTNYIHYLGQDFDLDLIRAPPHFIYIRFTFFPILVSHIHDRIGDHRKRACSL